jgi:hypothetical protein
LEEEEEEEEEEKYFYALAVYSGPPQGPIMTLVPRRAAGCN